MERKAELQYNRETLKNDLEKMGLHPTDAVMIHSSLKAIGPVEGGADTVIDALMDYFKEGLLMMPTHTWKQMSEEYNVFDSKTEPGCVGILPNIFRTKPGVVRSLHPTHSMAVYGVGAEEYIQGEENLKTPCAPEGCWGRLRDINAKILLIGVTHARNTYIHSIEESFDVPERFTAGTIDFQVKMPDGHLKKVSVYRHYNRHTEHISESYDKMLEGYFETGAARKGKLGDAECILCDAGKLFRVTEKILKKEINCFIDCENIPREWYV